MAQLIHAAWELYLATSEPKYSAIETEFVEWVEGNPYSNAWLPTDERKC